MFGKSSKKLASLGLVSALSLGAFAAPFSTQYVHAETANIKIQLLGINDLHGKINNTYEEDIDGDGEKETIGSVDYLAAHLKKRKAENPNTVLVNAGDNIGASPLISAALHDEPTINILEAMGLGVGTLGNHEFDEGIDELKRIVNGGERADGNGTKGYDGADFPVIAANAYDTSTNQLIFDPYYIKEIAGTKIGFIGVVTQETPDIIIKSGNENLKITDEAEAINKYAKELEAKGVNAIVVLAHNPTNEEGDSLAFDAAKIAEKVDDNVDVIFAGHNHKRINRTVDGKLIVEAYEYGKAFTDVDIEIDPTTNDIVKKTGEIVYNDHESVTPDPDIKAMIAEYQAKSDEIGNVVVGETKDALPGGYAERGPVGDNPLGNLIADGMKASMNADIAMMNGGGIREDLNKGPVTYAELFNIQPFGNYLVKISLSGKEVKELLNNQISEQYGPDFSVAGISYKWDRSTQNVTDVLLPDGQPIDESKEYSVVLNNFMFGDPNNKIADYFQGEPEVGKVDLDATQDFIKSFKDPIEYKAESRIQEVSSVFKDVPKDKWSNPFVTDLFYSGVSKGTSAGVFSPDREMTRAQFASMVSRTLKLKASKPAPFSDLNDVSKAVQDEISAAYEAGITKGTSASRFSPNESITRAEMVTMLIRAYDDKYGKTPAVMSNDHFTDLTDLPEEQASAVNLAYELGIIDGVSEKTFEPKDDSTRSEAAKVFSLFLHQK
ncbi:5'-nucleotidase C-terminal domain-containing protein [Falsibacillus pallidus]|uniref:5'-nucleotidase n=1 Tax=Falsibacillus pallidus TaxID=493781 RepID=A0A370G874_9BACI|nr:5'-nucleotidase C-terminal domain-containing protein [Falsibacillus pallidus]RDI39988.1 5'-nucleotidase [Falsibacillus pallidus]